MFKVIDLSQNDGHVALHVDFLRHSIVTSQLRTYLMVHLIVTSNEKVCQQVHCWAFCERPISMQRINVLQHLAEK